MNSERFSTGLVFLFTHKRTKPIEKLPGLVMSPGIFNPEFKMGNLDPKTFQYGKFCRVNDFLSNRCFSNPDIFPAAICRVRGKTKIVRGRCSPGCSRSCSQIDGHQWMEFILLQGPQRERGFYCWNLFSWFQMARKCKING